MKVEFLSSAFLIAQILVQSQFEVVILVLALEATEMVFELVTQMAVEQLSHYSKREGCKSFLFFHIKTQPTYFEMMLKCC